MTLINSGFLTYITVMDNSLRTGFNEMDAIARNKLPIFVPSNEVEMKRYNAALERQKFRLTRWSLKGNNWNEVDIPRWIPDSDNSDVIFSNVMTLNDLESWLTVAVSSYHRRWSHRNNDCIGNEFSESSIVGPQRS